MSSNLNLRMVFILNALLVFLYGCSGDSLPKYWSLDSLRILSIVANQPELNDASGSRTVTLTPLVSDAKGGGRTLTYSFQGCADPGISLGASISCDQDPAKVSGAGTITAGTLTTANNFTAQVDSISVSIPSNFLSGKNLVIQNNGYAYLVIYNVSAADGTTQTAIKRILISNRVSPNTNPVLTSVLSNGVAISRPTTPVNLSSVIGTGSQESYQVINNDLSLQSLTESMTTTWFASGGSFKYSRTVGTDTNEYTPGAATEPLTLVAILRDGRGGEAVQIYNYP